MAKADRPGVTTRRNAVDASQQIMTITVRGVSKTLAVGNLPFREKLEARRETGIPFEQFYSGRDRLGGDSLVVLWWLARRANGEPDLMLDQAADDWPADLQDDELDVTVEGPDDGADDPEA